MDGRLTAAATAPPKDHEAVATLDPSCVAALEVAARAMRRDARRCRR
jgi:hypothetical protein